MLRLLDRARSVTVVRLTRDGDRNRAAVLDGERVAALWSDPVLRYSQLLDGLFHRGVIVCEAEGDVRLYNATLDARLERSGEAATDVLFTSAGGKHKLAAAVAALRPLGVPVAAIADLDILRAEQPLRALVEALGREWNAFDTDARRLRAVVAAMETSAPTVGSVREQMLQALGEDGTARVTEKQSRRVREITKVRDGWRIARENGGVAALPARGRQQGRKAADRCARGNVTHEPLSDFVASVAAFVRSAEATDEEEASGVRQPAPVR